ncbi:hypothetical protein [Moraxella lacunata]|uniref:hypothetical protein n=1 Tax=Moraxella lacunata TaxID=477 RepID=UPI003EDFFC97
MATNLCCFNTNLSAKYATSSTSVTGTKIKLMSNSTSHLYHKYLQVLYQFIKA